MADRVAVTVDDGVADVKLDRAEKLNALDSAMVEGIVAAGEQVGDDPTVRAVVLSGAGRGFCAGLDCAAFGSMIDDGDDAAHGAVAGVLTHRPVLFHVERPAGLRLRPARTQKPACTIRMPGAPAAGA